MGRQHFSKGKEINFTGVVGGNLGHFGQFLPRRRPKLPSSEGLLGVQRLTLPTVQ